MVALDTEQLDRLLAMGARHGIDQEVELFGLLGIWCDEAAGFGQLAPDAPDARVLNTGGSVNKIQSNTRFTS